MGEVGRVWVKLGRVWMEFEGYGWSWEGMGEVGTVWVE